jgi:uncharacterized membrane protein
VIPAAGARPPIVRYSPELRPLLAVALGCHGNPDRCLEVAGWRTPICARCVGFVGGNALGLAALFALGPATWGWAFAGLALLVPVAVDGSLQAAGRMSTNPRRLATGLLGGMGQILILGAILAAWTPVILVWLS